MKDSYNTKINLKCLSCGHERFDFNEDKSHVQCKVCNREYLGGFDELLSLNEENIKKGVNAVKEEIVTDIKVKFRKMFK